MTLRLVNRTLCSWCAFSAAFSFTGAALAQDDDAEIFEPANGWADTIRVSLHGGALYQFETDLEESDGEFDVWRAGVGLTARTEFTEEISLSLRGDYQYDLYDFHSETLGDDDLWKDIHTISVGAIINFEISDDWELFAGPVLQFSFEGGAQGGEAVTFGGIFGVAYRASSTLTIGAGFGVTSQIEEVARFFPVFILNWQITDRLAMRNSPLVGAGVRDGLELVYEFDDRWEAAIGGGYYFSRFRIEGEGIFEDGVGEDTAIPLWLRISHDCTENFKVNIYGGVLAGGELRLEDEDGDGISSSDYDPAPFVGISGTYRF